MRLAFLEHKFKLLDKCHVEIYKDVCRIWNQIFGQLRNFRNHNQKF